MQRLHGLKTQMVATPRPANLADRSGVLLVAPAAEGVAFDSDVQRASDEDVLSQNGATRSGLQSDPADEHHWCPTDHGRDPGTPRSVPKPFNLPFCRSVFLHDHDP